MSYRIVRSAADDRPELHLSDWRQWWKFSDDQQSLPGEIVPIAAHGLRSLTTEQAANRTAVDRFRGTFEPIEWGESIIVPEVRIGAVSEQNFDSLHESCFGRIVQRGRPSAVGQLDRLAPVIDSRTVTQKRRHVLGIVLSALISSARKLDPVS
jgi:hypothetical protein